MRVQVVVTYDQGLRIFPMQHLKQLQHRQLLRQRARVGGLTADVQPAFITDANRVTVMVQAVGSYHPLRTAWLDLSVTTDFCTIFPSLFTL